MRAHYPRSFLTFSLSLPFLCFVLSEARVPSSSFSHSCLLCCGYRFSACFSPAPPPSPTFACSPGGMVILARHEFALQEQHVPSLQRWRVLGRVVVASLRGPTGEIFVLLACYGLPPSHPQRRLSEGPTLVTSCHSQVD